MPVLCSTSRTVSLPLGRALTYPPPPSITCAQDTPFLEQAPPHCVLTTRPSRSFDRSQKFTVLREPPPDVPPPASGRCGPPVPQKEVKCLHGHHRQTQHLPFTAWSDSVLSCGILSVYVPREPSDQSASVSALLTFEAWSFFVGGCPGHCGVWSGVPGLYPLDARISLLSSAVTTNNVSRRCQVPPGGRKTNSPHWELLP